MVLWSNTCWRLQDGHNPAVPAEKELGELCVVVAKLTRQTKNYCDPYAIAREKLWMTMFMTTAAMSDTAHPCCSIFPLNLKNANSRQRRLQSRLDQQCEKNGLEKQPQALVRSSFKFERLSLWCGRKWKPSFLLSSKKHEFTKSKTSVKAWLTWSKWSWNHLQTASNFTLCSIWCGKS